MADTLQNKGEYSALCESLTFHIQLRLMWLNQSVCRNQNLFDLRTNRPRLFTSLAWGTEHIGEWQGHGSRAGEATHPAKHHLYIGNEVLSDQGYVSWWKVSDDSEEWRWDDLRIGENWVSISKNNMVISFFCRQSKSQRGDDSIIEHSSNERSRSRHWHTFMNLKSSDKDETKF